MFRDNGGVVLAYLSSNLFVGGKKISNFLLACVSPRCFSILRNKHLNMYGLFNTTMCSGFFRCALFFHPEILSRIHSTTLSRHSMGHLLVSKTWLMESLKAGCDTLCIWISAWVFFIILLYTELFSGFALYNGYFLWSNTCFRKC